MKLIGLPEINHIGKPLKFDVEKFIELIDMMIDSDEIINALKMFDLLPSYYLDFPDIRLENLKKQILSQTVTIEDYISNFDQELKENVLNHEKQYHKDLRTIGDMIDLPFCNPRGKLALELVKNLNNQGIKPNVVELGPAQYWLPLGLMKYKASFNYLPITINKKAMLSQMDDIKSNLGFNRNNESIFICFETIEHLWNPNDIKHYYSKQFSDIDAKYILISTPKHCLLGGHQKSWRDRDIEHLRTYSPSQLLDFCEASFPYREWTFFDSAMMVFFGVLK